MRFYFCTALGVVLFYLIPDLPPPLRFIAAGNAFFVAYIGMAIFIVMTLKPSGLRARAAEEDEGIFLIVVIMIAIITVCCIGIFAMLNQHQKPNGWTLALVLMCAPLGWLTLHMVAAKHYANLYYGPDPETPERPPLLFPGGDADPGTWDFLYYSFVVGMTAQVSDVQITETKMRRATLGHAIISFFYNTVLIAMAVNAAVALAA